MRCGQGEPVNRKPYPIVGNAPKDTWGQAQRVFLPQTFFLRVSFGGTVLPEVCAPNVPRMLTGHL